MNGAQRLRAEQKEKSRPRVKEEGLAYMDMMLVIGQGLEIENDTEAI